MVPISGTRLIAPPLSTFLPTGTFSLLLYVKRLFSARFCAPLLSSHYHETSQKLKGVIFVGDDFHLPRTASDSLWVCFLLNEARRASSGIVALQGGSFAAAHLSLRHILLALIWLCLRHTSPRK
ncbi:hypothetical protein FA10DRAFT_140436 [Acaromyces ingoldii]|uniref:Uncharacterized protein n=1 Tax=Acaromyces ingoldii TaxID=215250 RepID=A0A316YKC6_9BASI|nr:hypothetical protein FA10DRAFT_140436 [Acaromyces ingoldii]PWN89264.1 hypothetical protein FA10DRAFT_140436 [Acaromyces ingoldii]